MTRDTKEIECANKCGVKTAVSLPKTDYHKGKKFLCGFCAAVGVRENEDQIKQVKLDLQTEVSRLSELLQEVKGSLDKLSEKLSEQSSGAGAPLPQAEGDRKLNIIVLGVSEEENKDVAERNEAESAQVSRVLQRIGITDDTAAVVSGYRRLGRFRGDDSERKRPLLLTCNNIWNRRRLFNAFIAERQTVDFRFRDDVPLTEARRNAIAEARRKNEEEKNKADDEGRDVENSFSPRDDGSVVQFSKRDGRWTRVENPAGQTRNV